VRPELARRELALAGVALLAAATALAVSSATQTAAPRPPTAVGSYRALAGSSGVASLGRRTACGEIISETTEGVASPVLPCGVSVYIGYGRKLILTRVIDRGPYVAGREFDLTPALAEQLGLSGVQKIDWSYAEVG
jgi:rare lipoprotein A (peptidoglycan hydrolase)